MIKYSFRICLLLVTFFLVACGQTGALYLPGHKDEVAKSHHISSNEGHAVRNVYQKVSS